MRDRPARNIVDDDRAGAGKDEGECPEEFGGKRSMKCS